MIRKLLRKYYHRAKLAEAKKRYTFLQSYNGDRKISQMLPQKNSYSVAFMLPGLPAFSGGITGIFRLGTYLEEFGNQVTYIDCSNSDLSELEKNARINYKDFKGRIMRLQTLTSNFDIGICTLWDTAYYLHEYSDRFNYKIYFVQDFEPFFYPVGDLYFLCRRTYQFGYHAITLGGWNAEKIKETFSDVKVDSIEFPVELKVYELIRRKILITSELHLAIFIKLEPKRAPDLILQCLIQLENQLRKKNVKLNCWIFGTDISFDLPFAKSVGMLIHEDLQALYNKCHMGLVASFTNISYVTFEMIASGLPVVEFSEGSAPYFFNSDELIFSDSNPFDFSRNIIHYIDHQDELNSLLERSQEAIKQRTWETSARRFYEIILNNAS